MVNGESNPIKRFIKIFRLGLIFLMAITLFSAACASRGTPGGGPLDRIPPEIISTIPQTDSLNVTTNLKQIEIEFSERMQQSSLINNVFISPPLDFEREWSGGRILRLVIKDTLKVNRTYVVVIGSNAMDLRRNSMDNSYQLAFSTGKRIDRGQISGRIFGTGRNNSAHIFAYIVDDSNQTNPIKHQPDYISQSGNENRYQLGYLKNNTYRLYTVMDQNNNRLLDGAYEQVGIPYTDVTVDSAEWSVSSINFWMSQIDTLAPSLISVRPINHTALQVRFSEPPDYARMDSFQFSLRDSITGQSYSILGFAHDEEGKNLVNFFTEPLDSTIRYQLHATYLSDSSGNQNKAVAPIAFYAATKRDTTPFQLINFTPPDSAQGIMPFASIELRYNK
ncbi:MAG: hypothetical protein GF313_02175, partial [Caldithrix sp.]|nr:hypothetical protein [Caldithrix sp.]